MRLYRTDGHRPTADGRERQVSVIQQSTLAGVCDLCHVSTPKVSSFFANRLV